jgi:hypothetical protein
MLIDASSRMHSLGCHGPARWIPIQKHRTEPRLMEEDKRNALDGEFPTKIPSRWPAGGILRAVLQLLPPTSALRAHDYCKARVVRYNLARCSITL